MIAIGIIFVAMSCKDVLQAIYIKALGNAHPWRAGHFDGATDLLAVGFVGVNIYNHPHRTEAWTLCAFAALYCGSVIGTRLGYAFDKWWSNR